MASAAGSLSQPVHEVNMRFDVKVPMARRRGAVHRHIPAGY